MLSADFRKSPRLRRSCFPLVALCLFSSAGCDAEPTVQQYRTPKEAVRATGAGVSAPAAGSSAWFFKLTGPDEQVMRQFVSFSAVLRTLEFESSGAPKFDAPSGWDRSAGPPPRFATLKQSTGDPKLEIAVSSLPLPDGDFGAYLRSNVDRWRGQLGLPPVSGENWLEAAQDANELVIVPARSGTIYFLNLAGQTPEFGESRMLAALVDPRRLSAGNAAPAVRSSAPPLTFEAPEGWAKSAGNAMRLASFDVPGAEGKSDVSVTRLPGGGDWLGNVNRWRGQVNLPDWSAEELDAATTSLTIGGRPAKYVSLVGESQTILAALVEEGEMKWFFKLQGPKESAGSAEEDFRTFLDSVKFSAP